MREEQQLDFHYILLWEGEPTIAERDYRPGRFEKAIKRPGTLSLGQAGRLPGTRVITPYHVTACTIDENGISSLLEEREDGRPLSLHEHLGVEDERLAHLMRLLVLEAECDGAGGRLYCDSIEHALLSRFVAVGREVSVDVRGVSALPSRILRRIIDKLETEYENDLTLSELASESGYSRSHFLKMFEAATGKTPFLHLRDIRLEKARLQLLESTEDITSIALSVGFSSHSHLTRLFTRKYGCSPSKYRRLK